MVVPRRPRLTVVLAAVAAGVLLLVVGGIVLQRQQVAQDRRTPGTLSASRWRVTDASSGPGYAGVERLAVAAFPAALRTATPSRVPAGATGEIGSVVIPATVSHFVARPAIISLPPAALVPHPRPLPVVIAFSGQSRGAGPQDLALKAHLGRIMAGIAAQHHGVAPIVVVPDQLGPGSGNPMCVDSAHFGRVATYVMTDVRTWILGHLPVTASRAGWTVAGFSEGGTCAIQFGAAHPDVFGSIVDVSGELAPTNGTLQHTVAAGFGGERTAYLHATPFWILAHHRYRHEAAYFAVGALDSRYGPVAPRMAAHAHAAGMTVRFRSIPHDAHRWITGIAGLTWGLTAVAQAET